jgi:uncharacterized membrane protein YhaH (DUF805 family)
VNWYLQGLRKYAVFSGRARRKEYWMFELINSLIPSFAKVVRRLHDTNHSGWWFFITMIPLVGLLIFLRLMVADSDPGENRFGPNPKAVPVVSSAPGMGHLAPPLPHDRP